MRRHSRISLIHAFVSVYQGRDAKSAVCGPSLRTHYIRLLEQFKKIQETSPERQEFYEQISYIELLTILQLITIRLAVMATISNHKQQKG